MSGIYGEDLRPRWTLCLYGTILKAFRILELADHLSSNWMNVFQIDQTRTQIGELYSLATDLYDHLPEEEQACNTFLGDFVDQVELLLPKFSPFHIFGVVTNLIHSYLAIIVKCEAMLLDIYDELFFEAGQKGGKAFIILIQ